MTTRADWLRNQIAWAESVQAEHNDRDWPFGDGGMSQHLAELKADLAAELASLAPDQPPTPPVSCTRSHRELALRDIVDASGRYTEFDEQATRGNALQTVVICAVGALVFYGSLYALLWWWL